MALNELKKQAADWSFYDSSYVNELLEYLPRQKKGLERDFALIDSPESTTKQIQSEISRFRNKPIAKAIEPLLNIIKKEAYVNQRQLSEASGYSLGKVNTSLAELVKAGYLNADYRLTEQAKELFTENRPNQAVILAAGAGMRMIPINTEVSKGMLEVRGETLVERLIKQLKEKGIHKITIVVGFMKEQYEYLIDEYGVELVYNKEYAVKNNLFSLAKVKDRLENAYIVPCDLWVTEQILSQRLNCIPGT